MSRRAGRRAIRSMTSGNVSTVRVQEVTPDLLASMFGGAEDLDDGYDCAVCRAAGIRVEDDGSITELDR